MCVSLGFLARDKLPGPVVDIPWPCGLRQNERKGGTPPTGLLGILDGRRNGGGQKMVGGRGTRGCQVFVETSPRRY